jgi:hypothetical protein
MTAQATASERRAHAVIELKFDVRADFECYHDSEEKQ